MPVVTTLEELKQDLATKPRNRGLTPVAPGLVQAVGTLTPAEIEALLPHGAGCAYDFKLVLMDDDRHGVSYVSFGDGYETPDDLLVPG